MGLLADYQALGADQLQLATLNGNVVTASAALDAANAAVTAQNTVDDTASALVVVDLQAAPYNGFAAIVASDGSSITLLSVVPAVPPSTQAGLATQVIPIAN
jgi:hypothetical protein